MLEGRDLEAAVCHVALIELVLQSCCSGAGRRSLRSGFSQPCAALCVSMIPAVSTARPLQPCVAYPSY